jgi:hypothetical protein
VAEQGSATSNLSFELRQANGARLGWLLIPEQRAVEVWGPLGEHAAVPQLLAPASQLDGSSLFPGLLVDLQEIWVA